MGHSLSARKCVSMSSGFFAKYNMVDNHSNIDLGNKYDSKHQLVLSSLSTVTLFGVN